jgi:hypothetical protein
LKNDGAESPSVWTQAEAKCSLENRGKMRMTETTEQERTPTFQQLAAEFARLRERVEDLEDARDLDAAISRNGEKPLIPWDQAKANLGL